MIDIGVSSQYVVGIPVLFLMIMFSGRNFNERTKSEFQNKFSTIFNKYNEKYYWFEAVILLRKASVVAVKLFATSLPALQGLAGIITIGASTITQYALRPCTVRFIQTAVHIHVTLIINLFYF